MSDGGIEGPDKVREAVLRWTPSAGETRGGVGSIKAQGMGVPQVLQTLEGRRENHPSFLPPSPSGLLPLSPIGCSPLRCTAGQEEGGQWSPIILIRKLEGLTGLVRGTVLSDKHHPGPCGPLLPGKPEAALWTLPAHY